MANLATFVNTLAVRAGGARYLVLGLGALLVLGVWGVTRWAASPMYVALYQELEYQDAARIEEALLDAGIPSRLEAGGTQVAVPVAEVAKARVALAQNGVVVGRRPGLELFDKPAWGMTDFSQRVTFQRAMEGELARTVSGIRGVEKAQVHLALPAASPLRKRQQPASASVVLSLIPGTRLPSETVQGITYVVSNSVEGLDSENVAVMDDGGNVLSVPSGNGGSGHATRQLDAQKSLEQLLVQKIHDLLEPVVGEGRVKAEVSAQLGFDKVDRAVETFGPIPARGDPANPIPEAENITDSFGARELKRSEGAVGQLNRLTAAVIVDEAAVRDPGDTTSAARFTVQELEAMVADAIGIDRGRGDRLSVVTMPFEVNPAAKVPTAGTVVEGPGRDIVGMIERLARPVVGLFAVIVLALMALKTLRMPTAAPAPAGGDLPATAAAGGPTGLVPNPQGGEQGGSPMPIAVGQEPNLQVVRGWLDED